MNERDSLPSAEELAALLRRAINDRKSETIYDAQGVPVAFLVPASRPGTPAARAEFLQLLRELREGDPDEQRRQWEELEAVLAEERLPEPLP
jgi:antitoxin (DNA-binding transcriptional repressor) of toxin-antitoxin stability system